MRRQIEVTPDVFHLIWSHWRQGDIDENSILKRTLSQFGEPKDLTPEKSIKKNLQRKKSRPEVTELASSPELGKIRWVDDVRRAFSALGGEADLSAVYPLVEKIRREAGRSTVASLEATIRQTIEAHSSDSRNFKPGNEDYFRHVSRGRWALR